MAPRRLLLVRHAQSVWNAEGRFQGQADPPLSALGRRQAQFVAERLAPLAPVAIHTSDLGRCRETAAPLAAALGLEPVAHVGLREIDVGRWSGLTVAEIEATHPDEFARWRAGEDVRRGGGERFSDLTVRAVAFLEWVGSAYDGGVVVAVSHGGWIRALACHVLGLPQPADGLGGMHNTGLCRIGFGPRGPRVESYNDHAHLDHVVDHVQDDRVRVTSDAAGNGRRQAALDG